VSDAATDAWVAVVGSGNVSAGRKAIVDTLVVGLKADGIWAKLDRLWLLAADNAASAMTDLKGLETVTLVNSPPFTPNSGYATYYSAYLQTAYNFSTATNFTQNSAHLAVWNLTTGTDVNPSLTESTGPALDHIFPRYNDGNAYLRINDVSSGIPVADDCRGFFLGTRTGTAPERQSYFNGALLGSYSLASSAPSNDVLLIFTRQLAVVSAGGHLNATEQLAFYNRLTTYLTDVGAITGLIVAPTLAVGAPVLGTPVLAQIAAVLSAAALTVGHPVIGAPVVAQTHTLGPGNLAVGAPAFGATTLSTAFFVLPAAVPLSSGHPFLGYPAITATVYTTETAQWITAVGAANVSTARARLVDALIVGMKTDVIWNARFDRLWLLAAENQASAVIDIANRVAADATSSTPAFTVDRGYLNTDTQALNTNFVPNVAGVNYTQSTAHISCWNLTDGAIGGASPTYALTAGGQAGGPFTLMIPKDGSSNFVMALNDGPSGVASLAIGDCRGLLLANRSSVANREAYRNGVSLGAITQAIVATAPGGSIFAGNSRQLASISIGGSLSSTEQLAFYNRLRTYMTEVGVPTGLLIPRSLAVGEPYLGRPTMVMPLPTALAAASLAVGAPAFSLPGVGQAHVIGSLSLAVASPAIGNSTMEVTATVVAQSLVVANSVAFGAPTIVQTHILDANALPGSAPGIGAPILVHLVAGGAIALTVGHPAFDAPAIGQAHVLVAGALVDRPPVVGIATAAIVGNTIAYPLAVANPIILGAPVLAQAHIFATAGLAGGVPTFGAPTIAQRHVLVPAGLAVPILDIGIPFLAIVGVTVAIPLVVGRPEFAVPIFGLRGQVYPLDALSLLISAPMLGLGRELEAPPVIWFLNRLKRWSTDPSAPYYDEDGSENGAPVQEAIFSNLNDELELTVSELSLVGRTSSGLGAAEAIKVEPPLYLRDGKLFIDLAMLAELLAQL
jgi:hypothetical protein